MRIWVQNLAIVKEKIQDKPRNTLLTKSKYKDKSKIATSKRVCRWIERSAYVHILFFPLTHIHTHRLSQAHTHTRKHTLTHAHICSHTHKHMLTLTHTRSHNHTFLYSHTHAHTHSHTHIQTHTYNHTHTLTLIRTHSYTHTPSLTLTRKLTHTLTHRKAKGNYYLLCKAHTLSGKIKLLSSRTVKKCTLCKWPWGPVNQGARRCMLCPEWHCMYLCNCHQMWHAEDGKHSCHLTHAFWWWIRLESEKNKVG